MFYKKDNNGDWVVGIRIILPTNEELTENNTENSYGWEWHTNPPQEYLDWLELNEQKQPNTPI